MRAEPTPGAIRLLDALVRPGCMALRVPRPAERPVDGRRDGEPDAEPALLREAEETDFRP